MLVSEILENIRPAYCDSWEEVFDSFKKDPHEWRRIEELMEEIRSGKLREPGRIDTYEPDEDDEDKEAYQYLGNGTHRFAAHVELGLEDYPVVFEDTSPPIEYFYTMTEVEIWIKREFLDADPHEDRIMDCFCSSLSFKVNENCWAEMGSCGSTGTGTGLRYNLGFNTMPAEHLSEFATKFLDRISCCVTPNMIDYFSVGNMTHYEPKFWGGEED